MSSSGTQVKSGIKVLKPGDIIFNDGEVADSLFIIQKGQIRLFKPKGKGFIELAVLRAGEVIGEMAYFDEDGSGRKRSCSAEAITTVEIIEISFAAFGKTMQSLNPWFKTIITTLVQRLRKTNFRIKELEDNQAVLYGAKSGNYEFLRPIEVMKILGTFFLVFKAHGEERGNGHAINKKTLQLYTRDMYQIQEVKLESMLGLLMELGWLESQEDADKLNSAIVLKDIEVIRQIFIYYNGERHLPEDKKLKISDRCEVIISKMVEMGPDLLQDIPNLRIVDGVAPRFTKCYDLTPILTDLKDRNISVNPDHLHDGKNVGLFGEVLIEDGKVLVETDYSKVDKLYPVMRFMNAIRKLNVEKAPAGF